MSNNCWLPKLEYFHDYNNSWSEYEEALFKIFSADFINRTPIYKEQIIKFRWHPIEYNKPEAFYHVTCKDFKQNGERVPDFRRCERIRWIRSFIENYNCDPSLCNNCDGIKVWSEPFGTKNRVNILFEEERYIVILEPRKDYCLLITAFFLEHDHALKKRIKHYNQYRKK